MTLSRVLPLSLFAVALASSACAVWDPDYEPDPDVVLRDLVDGLEDRDEPLSPIERQRLQRAIERLATRHPSHVASQVAAGACAIDAGEPQRAQGYVDRALSLEPKHVQARALRVRIAVADGSLDLARRLVDDGLRLRPDAARLHESSAWLHQLEQRWDDALAALDTAAELDAPAWRLAFHRGLIEEQRGNPEAAETHFRAALDANANCTPAAQRLKALVAQRKIAERR